MEFTFFLKQAFCSVQAKERRPEEPKKVNVIKPKSFATDDQFLSGYWIQYSDSLFHYLAVGVIFFFF